MGITLLLILFIVLVAILICYHNVLTTCFFKHSYIKLLSQIFVLLLTILSIFYSVHGNIFADKNLEENFLIYPVNQILRNDTNNKKENKYKQIEYNTNKDKNINFVFIIDRTLSRLNNENVNIRKELSDRIDYIADQNHKRYFDICDFLLLEMVDSLKTKIDSLKNHQVSVVIYNGSKPDTKDTTCYKLIPSTNSFLQIYADSINKNKDIFGTTTDISKIFKLVQSKIDTNYYNVITVISDFANEKNISELDPTLKELTNNVTDLKTSLNLVHLCGSAKNDANEIERTKERIRKYSHFIFFDEYKEELLTQELSRCSFITQMPVKNNTTKIVFYYPLSYGKFHETSVAHIKFPNISSTDKFWFYLKSESSSEKIYLKIEENISKKSYQLIDQPELIEVDSTKQFSLALKSQGKPDNLFLEITHPKNLTRQKIQIVFMEYLTNNVCYILIILNTFFIILLIFLSFFFYYKCRWHCYRVRSRKFSNIILILPVLGFVFFVMYVIKIIQTLLLISSDFILIWSLIIVVFIGFLVRFFYSEADDELLDKKCNELH